MLQKAPEVVEAKQAVTKWLSSWKGQPQKDRHGALMLLTDSVFYRVLGCFMQLIRQFKQPLEGLQQQVPGLSDEVNNEFNQLMVPFFEKLICVSGEWRPIFAAWVIESRKISDEILADLFRKFPKYVSHVIAYASKNDQLDGTVKESDFGSKISEQWKIRSSK